MIKIDNMNLFELRSFAVSLGEPSYRGDQLYKWIYNKKAASFEEMTDLPKAFREKLEGATAFTKIDIIEMATSKVDGSIKTLLLLEDGEKIESVLLKDDGRYTICVSSQVGCRMGCTFCSTAGIGFIRNLTSAEIIRQIILMDKLLESKGGKITNIVYMGMGEPLDNIENVIKSLEILTDEHGLGFSHRKVTVSTSGVVPNIEKLFSLKRPVNLAISLNATLDSVRNAIMPINKKYNISELMEKLKTLPLQKRKRITIEYVLLKGVNDTIDDAKRLISLIRGLPVKINLILYNTSTDGRYSPSAEKDALQFQKYLTDRNVTAFIRKSFGADINGACGQLYAKYLRTADR